MKIDFHSHILPNIDDGSKSVEMSLKMLKRLENQHVDKVVLTPHYYSHHESIEDYLEKQRHSYELLLSALNHTPIQLYLGTEVYFSDYLFNNKDISELCIKGTKVMLLELPYNKPVDDRVIDKVDRLIGDYGIIPVIAHVERYPSLIRSRRLMDKLLSIGCVLQVNISSFSRFGKRRLLKLLREGYIGALGTDAHNLTGRAPEYDAPYSWLLRYAGSRVMNTLQQTMNNLI